MQDTFWRQAINEELNRLVEKGEWSVEGPVKRSRECDIYHASKQGSSRKIALKYFNSDVDADSPQNQFSALKAYQSMSGLGCNNKVPKVFGLVDDNRLILMEWCSGDSLARALWKNLPSTHKRLKLIRKTGEWLRSFHEVSGISPGNFEPDLYLVNIENQIARAKSSISSGCPKSPVFEQSFKILQERFYLKENCSRVKTAVSHGDFTPANLLVSGNTTTGIDFWALKRVPVDLDVTRMAVYLTIAYTSVFPKDVYSSDCKLCKDIDVLVKAYGKDALQSDSDHFKRALLAEYLRRWVVIENRRVNAKNCVQKTFQLHWVERQVRCVTRAIARA